MGRIMDSICKCGCRPDPLWLKIIELEQNLRSMGIVNFEKYINYPEDVKPDSLKALLRREQHKGKVYGHFC